VPKIPGAAVLVTGASSGIGEATAIAFARKGARLALCARRLDRLQAVGERCRQAGARAVTLRRADVGKRAEARAFVAAALRDFDRLDVVVNNAGSGWMGRFHEMPEEEIRKMIDTNLLGTIWVMQAALPSMLTARKGVVINVSSVVGFRALPYGAVYSATKHAMTGLSHALRGELSGTGVKVCVVYPSTTETEFFAGSERQAGPVYSANWVAATIVRTARWPRRDAIVVPFRVAHLAEPVFGGLLDHALGEVRRMAAPHLARPGALVDPGDPPPPPR
jgi:NADP-dependent 3-hydroxy acid dehydrogenase YdfG